MHTPETLNRTGIVARTIPLAASDLLLPALAKRVSNAQKMIVDGENDNHQLAVKPNKKRPKYNP